MYGFFGIGVWGVWLLILEFRVSGFSVGALGFPTQGCFECQVRQASSEA